MLPWALDELCYADLGDARLNRRLCRLVTDLAAQPTASVPQACGNWAATKAAYRFWDLAQVKPADIRRAHLERSLDRIRVYPTVLAIQDTTDLDFTAHPATRDLGPLHAAYLRGLKVHSALAASPDGVPLGLVDQIVWARDPDTLGHSKQRRKRPTSDKESQRVLDQPDGDRAGHSSADPGGGGGRP
jgi:transposase-like protein